MNKFAVPAIVALSAVSAFAAQNVVKVDDLHPGIVISKDNPALTKAINEALAELTADGTIDRLVQQYLS